MTEYLAGWRASGVLLRQGRPWSGSERNCAFLNCGSSRFANISSVTGLDFLDDGRGLATVDWDHDGDLDLWLSNRTGPRLRLMLNQTSDEHRRSGADFVAFKLRGTSWTANVDAIGARVEVYLADDTNQKSKVKTQKLLRTLHAGDGFLSQSSKWLHFGLGSNSRIERVVVRWPGAGTEEFTDVQPGRHYSLVEGSRRAKEWIPPRSADAVKLVPSPQAPPKRAGAAHVLLPLRVPMPILSYLSAENAAPRALEVSAGPLLINLWASWCIPCIAELKDFAEIENKLRAAGLNVLALSVDGLDENKHTQPADAKRFLDQIKFPFDSGVATTELLDKMDIINEFVYDRTAPFAVPVSFLVDRKGQLAAVYRGRVDVDVLLRDVANLDQGTQELRQLAVPFPGRWYGRPGDIDLVGLSSMFEETHAEDTVRYIELALAQFTERRKIDPDSKERRKLLDDEQVAAHLRLTKLLREQGRANEAIMHARQAVQIDSNSADAHYDLAVVLQITNRVGESIYHYRQVLGIVPDSVDAHQNLGGALASVGQFDAAIHHFRETARLRPNWPAPLAAMAMILATHPDPNSRQPSEAIRLGEDACAITRYQSAPMLDTLAAAYASAGRFDDAVRTAQTALSLVSAGPMGGLANRIRVRLELYEQKKPYYQQAPDRTR